MDSMFIELITIANLGLVAFLATTIFGILAQGYEPTCWVVDPVEEIAVEAVVEEAVVEANHMQGVITIPWTEVPEPQSLSLEIMAQAKLQEQKELQEQEERKQSTQVANATVEWLNLLVEVESDFGFDFDFYEGEHGPFWKKMDEAMRMSC